MKIKSSIAGYVLWGMLWMMHSASLYAQRNVPTEAARRVAKEIRHEALLPNNGPEGRPLPLASHWNVGRVRGTFEPRHQIWLIQQGHHILPWMSWPQSDPTRPSFEAYYGRLLRYFNELDLPISIRGTQWNAMLIGRRFRENPDGSWAGVISLEGERIPRLSPFGDVESWKIPAKVYVDNAAMRRAQSIYPDPPLVLLVSNNEPRELRWSRDGDLEKISGRYLETYGRGRSDEFKRRVVSEGWMERYPVMFEAMREAFVEASWRKNVRFIGYGAFGPSHFGRWGRWQEYSLNTEEWTAPDWYFWDGGSPSYYTNNWNDNRDYWVFSTQVESMNWVFMLEEAWQINPDFWFELSTWDGNSVPAWMQGLSVSEPSQLVVKSSNVLRYPERGAIPSEHLRKSKALQYIKDGQDYPPERAAGWMQFGLWLMRPRVVREFRGHSTQLEPVFPYWMETVKAVDRVYENETLKEFWRFGNLVANTTKKHPYRVNIPDKYNDVHRWFLLDTNLDPERPWDLRTVIPVFSLAYELGEKGERRWLVYAHAPLVDRNDVEITVPNYGPVTVSVERRGSFFLVTETDKTVVEIE